MDGDGSQGRRALGPGDGGSQGRYNSTGTQSPIARPRPASVHHMSTRRLHPAPATVRRGFISCFAMA
jgi:hypothetical protein